MSADDTDDGRLRPDVKLTDEGSLEDRKKKEERLEGVGTASHINESSSKVIEGDIDDGKSHSLASSNTLKRPNTLQRKLLEQLGVYEVGELDERDNNTISYFLQIKLEQEKKEVEKLRDANLERLDRIIDKCDSSKNLTQQSINAIIDVFMEKSFKQQQHEFEVSPYSSEKRRKIINAQAMSPGTRNMSQQDYNRELHYQQQYLGHEAAQFRNQAQPQFQPLQSMVFPYPVQYQGNQGSNMWGTQQLGPPAQIPAGLGSPSRSQRPISDASTTESTSGSNQSIPTHNTSSGMQTTVQPYSSSSQMYSTFGPYLVPPETGHRGPSVILQQYQNHNAQNLNVKGYVKSPQNVHQSYRIKGENVTTKRHVGHRRSHSSVTTTSNYNHLRSPVRELQATPQKPVNFLIHTPKYPPPT